MLKPICLMRLEPRRLNGGRRGRTAEGKRRRAGKENLKPRLSFLTFATSNPTITWCTLITDRKSTRLNSSHGYISYAVFCLKKKKTHLSYEKMFNISLILSYILHNTICSS